MENRLKVFSSIFLWSPFMLYYLNSLGTINLVHYSKHFKLPAVCISCSITTLSILNAAGSLSPVSAACISYKNEALSWLQDSNEEDGELEGKRWMRNSRTRKSIMDNTCAPHPSPYTLWDLKLFHQLHLICVVWKCCAPREEACLQRQMDASHTQGADTQLHTNAQIPKHLQWFPDNSIYSSPLNGTSWTHTPAWLTCYRVLF